MVELSRTIILIFYSFFVIAVFCNCGEMVTNAFESFDEELRRCKWYLFPTDLKYMLVVAIANAQRPTTIRGYGDIQCTRNAFRKVK